MTWGLLATTSSSIEQICPTPSYLRVPPRIIQTQPPPWIPSNSHPKPVPQTSLKCSLELDSQQIDVFQWDVAQSRIKINKGRAKYQSHLRLKVFSSRPAMESATIAMEVPALMGAWPWSYTRLNRWQSSSSTRNEGKASSNQLKTTIMCMATASIPNLRLRIVQAQRQKIQLRQLLKNELRNKDKWLMTAWAIRCTVWRTSLTVKKT